VRELERAGVFARVGEAALLQYGDERVRQKVRVDVDADRQTEVLFAARAAA